MMGRIWSVLLLLVFIPLVLSYQNCAPIESTRKTADSDSRGGDGTPGTGIGGTDVTDVTQLSEGQRYFVDTVIPMFEQSSTCFNCHSAPRFGGSAPLSIYNYNQMIFRLANGNSTLDNELMNKIQGNISHGGGNRCLNGIEETPCKEIIAWRAIEFPLEVAGTNGAITVVTTKGRITGWIRDGNEPGRTFTALIYDGPAGQGGSQIASVQANQFGSNPQIGQHYFSYQLPANLADGTSRSFYVYADNANSDNLIPGMPRSYTAYTPTAAGRNYFNANIAAEFQARCTSCHNPAYDDRWNPLASPAPNAGGSASNNDLVIKVSGGNSHGGGSFCNGINNGLCANIQQWWNLEFGN